VTAENDDRIAYLAGEDGGSLASHERADLDELRALLGAPAIWEEPAPDLEARIVAAIAQEARARPADARRRARRAWRTWPRPMLGLAGIAAATLLTVVIVLSANHGGPPAQRFAMVVSGTPLAPSAHGSARLTKTASGWRIELTATGLAHLANGRYYQAWLKNPAGILVPVGTFNDARHVTLWAGVPATQFPVLTITEQQANGNPASSGQRVLTGTISGRR
jgi:Anti-sigma-K factor rskA